MRVLMLAWDFPPRTGGASAHVDGLTTALATRGHDVVVLTVRQPGGAGAQAIPLRGAATGIRVLLANVDLPWIPDEFHVASAASACHHIVQLTTELAGWVPDVVHAHNWDV